MPTLKFEKSLFAKNANFRSLGDLRFFSFRHVRGVALNRRRNAVIGLISALVAGFMVYGVYILLLKQVEWQQTVRVVVPKELIPAGTLIEAGMLEYKLVLAGAFEPGMMSDMDMVVGAEPYIPLGSKEPILSWKLDRLRLAPKQNQATFQIPKDYILSISNGIRAGDQVSIYVSGADGLSQKLFPTHITVASVKSASNVEVDHPVQTNFSYALQGDQYNMYASRRNANGSIDQINLNLTEEQWLQIDKACKDKKSKLVIALTPFAVPGSSPP
jgi:hypothetical protein